MEFLPSFLQDIREMLSVQREDSRGIKEGCVSPGRNENWADNGVGNLEDCWREIEE